MKPNSSTPEDFEVIDVALGFFDDVQTAVRMPDGFLFTPPQAIE